MCIAEPVVEPREGLRERRRRETHEELHAVTLRLCRESGFDHVTVEMISKEAGVSPRTFFNYFPSKEAALLIWPRSLPSAEAARFAAMPGSDLDTVLRDVGRLLVAHTEPMRLKPEEVEEVFRIAERTPTVLAALLAQFDALERDVSDLIARRTGHAPDSEIPLLLAGMGMLAVRTGTRRWTAQSSFPGRDAADFIQHAFDVLRSLATSPADGGPGRP